MAVRLGMLAHDAQVALERIAEGEGDTIEGWLAYGTALNEGRALFASDEQFGQWLVTNNLSVTFQAERDADMWAAFGQWLVTANLAGTHDHERAAAMWAAANPDQFCVMPARIRAAFSVRPL